MTRNKMYPNATLRPMPHHAASITGGLLGGFVERSRKIGISDTYQKLEASGSIGNFRLVTGERQGRHHGGPNNNEFVYKWMEACGHYAGRADAGVIEELLDQVTDLVIAAQDEDGYVNTYYQYPENAGEGRFDAENRFEFYNFGHLAQAGIATYRSTGNRKLLDAALRFADRIVKSYGAPGHLPYRLNRGPLHLKHEHPNHEMAFVELFRITGNRVYLNFAWQTLNEYGYWDQVENEGHAVQEILLACAAVDLYMEIGEPRMLETAVRLWEDMYLKKMYVTGGVGSRYVSESYGAAYELPNDRAYTETCAAVSNVFWCYRMLLATGEIRYADIMERVLYNGFLSGISLAGDRYLYQNPLQFRPGSGYLSPDADGQLEKSQETRWEWHQCPCCPPNVHRLLASLGEYLYTTDPDGIQVHLYTPSVLSVSLPGGETVRMEQTTRYPWDPEVCICVGLERSAAFALSVRIPHWCHGARIVVADGESLTLEHGGLYHRIKRTWSDGDELRLTLPLDVRLEQGHPYTYNTGRVAVCRGPLVYCLEQVDNPGVTIFDVHLPQEVPIEPRWESGLLDGVVSLTGWAVARAPNRWRTAPYVPYAPKNHVGGTRILINMIPYYAWANREPSPMTVWIPVE